ncbi:Uncharacterized protein TPAR_08744 [Tolypocladium paradoxum]|uniref:Uncharacterized protein n=1 Tax=Tolypocladium paradoxum TaxID=94208 RepID=A0A2S4KLC2_9HYPO|nr:Uncharacterized protein TPAR_08744 [Tolypocladium paradoxum]
MLVAAVVAAGFAAAEPATSIAAVFGAEDLYAPVLASVIKADATATEYLLQCGALFDDGPRRRCGHATNDALILTHGTPAMASKGRDGTRTRGFDCKLQGSWPARCDFFDGEDAYEDEPDEDAELMMSLTMTEKLAAAAASGGNNKAATDTTSTAVSRSMAMRLALALDATTTKTTGRRTTAPTDQSPSDKPGGATNMQASVALLGRMLGLGTALGVL